MSISQIVSTFDSLMSTDITYEYGFYPRSNPVTNDLFVPESILNTLSLGMAAGRPLKATFQHIITSVDAHTLHLDDPSTLLILCLIPGIDSDYTDGSIRINDERIKFTTNNQYIAWYNKDVGVIEPSTREPRSIHVFSITYIDDFPISELTLSDKINGLIKKYVDLMISQNSEIDELCVILSQHYLSRTSIIGIDDAIINEFASRGYNWCLEERALLNGDAIDSYNPIELDRIDMKPMSKIFAIYIAELVQMRLEPSVLLDKLQSLIDDVNLDSYIEPDDELYAVVQPELLNALLDGTLVSARDIRHTIQQGHAFKLMAVQKSTTPTYYTCQKAEPGIELRSQIVFIKRWDA